MNLVPIWASPSPRDFVPHLDLIAVDSFLASPGSGDSDPNWGSPRSGDSGPQLGIIGTSFHCMVAGWPHLVLVSLVPTWESTGHGSSTWPAGWPHLDLVSGVGTGASPIHGDTGPHVGSLGPGESGLYLVLTRNC